MKSRRGTEGLPVMVEPPAHLLKPRKAEGREGGGCGDREQGDHRYWETNLRMRTIAVLVAAGGHGSAAFAIYGCGEAARVAGWGGDAAPLGGEEIHRRRIQCLRGQAELLPDGGPLAALGCAPEEVEGEAAWRRRGRPGAHLGEQSKQRRPLRQEPAMR